MTAPSLPAGFDFTDPALWQNRSPVEEFALLRRTAPVWWNAQSDDTSGGFRDGGYWVVSKLADVKEISRHPELYSSQRKGAIIRLPGDITAEQMDLTGALLVNMDPPKHSKIRRIVSKGFTPRAVESLRAALTERAERIVHAAKRTGGGDFVQQVACELPLQAIAELLGVPQDDRRKVFDWSNQMLNYDDPEYGDPTTASAEILGYAWTMAEQRRACPVHDIVSELVHADVDGEALASDEFGFFVILLAVAGNETTRNAITHGMKAFVDNPEQWEIYRASRPRTAPDEIVRWATPVTAFQRTATEDVVLGGQRIRAGQRLGLFYSSANFDEDGFTDPFAFDILRDPNPHVGFGGTGAHYCVGANLARLEIDLMFNAIADAMPNLRQVSDPVRLRSGWINGVKSWQVRYD
ncbi:cholest-4-en-3-one 26-monooxygenase [Nocardia amikacinitolerans]|uniref:Cholest-4-en-3-one 26-monooxygenase n=1 Tax=Nocardia amikacinitolerans TaxID=756689 RepID=A0A285KU76_9NOCA|nr:cytochrome P450 [Nocardia amikacinitolerans]MCP2275826.1 cholest-4-en-3-one 26-monooxygenase [Nocardia amikacinitolerans]SNY76175.1 cholest-4-en-3-one 26-monooxygenase [Nocardia amikacinitolerans]